jgi:hypothetical protein
MFHPAGLRVNLPELLLGGRDRQAACVKNNRPRTRRPLIKRKNACLHVKFLFETFVNRPVLLFLPEPEIQKIVKRPATGFCPHDGSPLLRGGQGNTLDGGEIVHNAVQRRFNDNIDSRIFCGHGFASLKEGVTLVSDNVKLKSS